MDIFVKEWCVDNAKGVDTPMAKEGVSSVESARNCGAFKFET